MDRRRFLGATAAAGYLLRKFQFDPAPLRDELAKAEAGEVET